MILLHTYNQTSKLKQMVFFSLSYLNFIIVQNNYMSVLKKIIDIKFKKKLHKKY